jgi:hypothetical protein
VALGSKTKKVLGIGCGAVLVIFMALLGGTVYFTTQMNREYKAVKELEEQLVTAHGPGNQLPAGHTGWPSPERMAVFLAVHQSTAEWRVKLETSFAEVLQREEESGSSNFGRFLQVLKASRDLAPVFSGFWTARNSSLLEQEMGIAEYKYLYCLAFYGDLGKDPSDGARDADSFLAGMGAGGAMQNTDDTGEAEAERRLWMREQINDLMLPLMQQAARAAASSNDPQVLMWAEDLQAEIRLLQDDPLRVPFAGSVPAALAEAMAPYRTRLEASYSVTVNPVELIFEESWAREE